MKINVFRYTCKQDSERAHTINELILWYRKILWNIKITEIKLVSSILYRGKCFYEMKNQLQHYELAAFPIRFGFDSFVRLHCKKTSLNVTSISPYITILHVSWNLFHTLVCMYISMKKMFFSFQVHIHWVLRGHNLRQSCDNFHLIITAVVDWNIYRWYMYLQFKIVSLRSIIFLLMITVVVLCEMHWCFAQ